MSPPSQVWTLNGTKISTTGWTKERLLDVLRDKMSFHSVKKGCDNGECGACTVLVDGEPQLACQHKIDDLFGKEVVTMEGLSEADKQRYAENFARVGLSCGFCLPGLLMRLHGHLQEHDTLSRKQALKLLGQHLCRCTGYIAWLDALQSTAQPDHSISELDLIDGDDKQTLPRLAASEQTQQLHALLEGEPAFVDDLYFPDMLHGAILLTPHARGHLLDLDTSPAHSIANVHTVLTAQMIPDHMRNLETPLLLDLQEESRCASDVIALVAAENEAAARTAISRIRALVNPLEPLTNAEYLRQRGDTHLIARHHLAHGDLNEAFRQAALVVSGTWYIPLNDPAPPPLTSCIAVPHQKDHLTIYSSTQNPALLLQTISEQLNLPKQNITIEQNKANHPLTSPHQPTIEAHAALLALHTQTPIKITLNRDEMTRLCPKFPAIRIHLSLASDKHGDFIGLRARILLDSGGHSTHIRRLLQRILIHACGPYRIPHFDLLAEAIATNNPLPETHPLVGPPQIAFALEGAVDLLSERLQMDGWSIRYRNALQPGDLLPNGQRASKHCSIVQTLEAIRDPYYRYIDTAGIACAMFGQEIEESLSSDVLLRLYVDQDEHIALQLPNGDLAQEFYNVLLHIASQESGLPHEQFHLEFIEAARGSNEWSADPANALLLTAALRDATKSLKDAFDQGSNIRGKSFQGLHPSPSDNPTEPSPSLPRQLHMEFATHLAVLDPSSGRIRRLVAAHDLSRAEDPVSVIHRLEGAIHMGIGFALTEHQPLSDGTPQISSLRQLGMIPPAHMPHIDLKLLTNIDPQPQSHAPISGAIGLIPVAPAIASAIKKRENKRLYQLPMADTMTALAHRPPKPQNTSRRKR